MMGERDLEAELKEKDEIIMSLRLNEHLLKDKLEISRRNMKKQLERITALEKENIELKKLKKYCAEWMGVKEENLSLRCGKMSEKRFVIDEEGISDNKTGKWYCWKEEVVDLLNEQQSIIHRDEMSIKTMMSNMEKLEEENEQLKKDLLSHYKEEN